MSNVDKILEDKGSTVWSMEPDNTVYDSIAVMDEKGIGALAIIKDGDLVGILSERDYARKVILKGRQSKTTLIKEIMTSKVYYTSPDQSIEQCMLIMTTNGIRHLPVIENKKLVGMISISDVVNEIIQAQQDKIEHLEHSITWGESY